MQTTCSRPGPSRTRSHYVAIALCALASLLITGSAEAQTPPTVTTEVTHSSHSEHFEGCGDLPGVTAYFTGTERLHVTEHPNGALHVSYGETFRWLEVSDDPSVPTREGQGTDALTFQLIDNGPTVFHESFHDNDTPWGDIFVFTTFVAVDGEVRVDRSFARNLPPEGC